MHNHREYNATYAIKIQTLRRSSLSCVAQREMEIDLGGAEPLDRRRYRSGSIL